MKTVYWSGSGNTEKMANLIAEGIKENGVETQVIDVSHANSDIFNDEDIIIKRSIIIKKDGCDIIISSIFNSITGRFSLLIIKYLIFRFSRLQECSPLSSIYSMNCSSPKKIPTTSWVWKL